jgi:hypothetical protein
MYIYRERNPPIKCCNPVFLAVHFVIYKFLQFQVEREFREEERRNMKMKITNNH